MPSTAPLDRMPGLDRRLVGDAERHDRDQRVEALVLVVDRGVDAPLTGELPEPEVALLFRGAHQEVGAPQLLVEDAGGLPDRGRASL